MLLRHSLLYALGRGLPGIVNFLAIAVYTRLLAPEAYGHYALVIAGAHLGNALLFQWLRLGLLRFLPAQGERPERLLATLLGGFLAMLVVIVAGGALALALLPQPGLRVLLGFALLFLAGQGWFELNLTLAQSQLSPIRYGLMALTRAGLGLALGIGLILVGLGAMGPVLGLTLAMLLGTVVFIGPAWRVARPSLKERALLAQLLAYGLPLTGSFALTFVVSSSDRFLIAWLLGSEPTGSYAAGYDVAAAAITVLMASVNLAGYPLAVRALEQGGEEDARHQLRQNLLLLLTVALPAATGLAILAPNIARVMLGAAFREAAIPLIPWVAFASVLASLRFHYLDLSFQLGRRTLRQMAVMLVAAITNLVLNLWWIPLLGLMGAAYATVVAYAVAFALSWHLGRRSFPLPPPTPEAFKVAAATLVMALVLWPLRDQAGVFALVGQLTLGGASYLLLLLALDLAGIRRWLRARLAATFAGRDAPAASQPSAPASGTPARSESVVQASEPEASSRSHR